MKPDLHVPKIILVPLFWSFVFPLSQVVLGEIPPFSLVATRFAIGALFLVAETLRTREGRELAGLLSRERRAMFLLGVLAVGSNACQVAGLGWAGPAQGALIAATAPVYAAALGSKVLGEKMSSYQVTGLLLSLGGAFGIALSGDRASGRDALLGGTLMFLGALAYAVYTVLGKRWNASSVPVLASSTALGVLPVLLLALLQEPFVPSLCAASPKTWLALLALGVLPTGVAVIWFFELVSRLGASRASVITYAVPVFGLAQSWLLLGEKPTLGLLLGGALSLLGVALAQYQKPTLDVPESTLSS